MSMMSPLKLSVIQLNVLNCNRLVEDKCEVDPVNDVTVQGVVPGQGQNLSIMLTSLEQDKTS